MIVQGGRKKKRAALLKKIGIFSLEDLRYIQEYLVNTIQAREKAEKYRLARYDDFKQRIEKLNRYFKSFDPSELRKIKELCKKIHDCRSELVSIFSLKETFAVCHKCKGGCCSFLCFGKADIHYLALLGYLLPKPTKYLSPFMVKSENYNSYNCCPFLSRNGCTLKENKPFICHQFTCEELRKKIDVEEFWKKKENLSQLIEEFERDIYEVSSSRKVNLRRRFL